MFGFSLIRTSRLRELQQLSGHDSLHQAARMHIVHHTDPTAKEISLDEKHPEHMDAVFELASAMTHGAADYTIKVMRDALDSGKINHHLLCPSVHIAALDLVRMWMYSMPEIQALRISGGLEERYADDQMGGLLEAAEKYWDLKNKCQIDQYAIITNEQKAELTFLRDKFEEMQKGIGGDVDPE